MTRRRTNRHCGAVILFASSVLMTGPSPGVASEAVSPEKVRGCLSEGHKALEPSAEEDSARASERTGCPEAEGLVIPDDAVVGTITVRAEELFDVENPKENRRLFRLANHLHRGTREEVIRQQLLFKTGDAYSAVLVAESERALRGDRYIYDSRVRPVAVHDGVVDVEVLTRDVWTLSTGVSFGRAGGEQSTAFSLRDSNFLGLGKEVALKHRSDVDRVSNQVSYIDPNLLGSRVRLDALFEDNSDGAVSTFSLGKPFESLESHWAAGIRLSSVDRIDPIYSLGQVSDRFLHRSTLVELSGGLSKGLRRHRAVRWVGGLTYQQDLFEPSVDFEVPSILPEDRTLVYPWIGVEMTSDAFATTRDLDNLSRTEDLYLGHRFRTRLGFASSQFGSDRNAAIFDGGADVGWRFSERQNLFLDTGFSGRWGSDGAENVTLRAGSRYYRRTLGRHQFYASLRGGIADNLDREVQLLLGGDNGLRGYPLRYQAGDANLLLTLEQRFYTHWYPWRLFHVGGAVFFDAGRAWGEGPAGEPSLGLLKDFGVGLRLGSARSSGRVIHFDVAFPLDGDSSIKGVQWLIKSKNTL